MTLFGSSKKTDNRTTHGATANAAQAVGGHNSHTTDQAGVNDRTSQVPGAGMQNTNAYGQTQSNNPNTNYDNSQTGSGQQRTGQPLAQSDPYSAAGVGSAGAGSHATRPGEIPPAGAIEHGTSHKRTSSHGSGSRFVGKVESAIGSMVGSEALKAKGLRRENEANSIKLQGRELAEAERLEREAMMRRERAVAHGADPANAVLGAGNPSVGTEHRQM